MKKIIFFVFLFVAAEVARAQERSVAIIMDDLPNVWLYQASGYHFFLQQKLDSLNIPVAIFINEGNIFQTDSVQKNKELLKSWIGKDYVTVGNHSFSHQNYADIGFDAFQADVLKGEILTKEYLKSAGKSMKYFRFPFNGLGKDSLDQKKMVDFLKSKNYISTPFTVESEDWLYAQLYDKALADGKTENAKAIGNQYVQMTIKVFDYFDSLSISLYNRPVRQIYLCHDSNLNTNFLPEIVQQLKVKKYRLISLDEAMKDPVYLSEEYYKGKDGFSWIYRWIQNPAQRKAAMRAEPSNPPIHKAFEEMNKGK